MINLKQALLDPTSVFNSPQEVLINSELSTEQKIQVLKRWESDMRELSVAEEENMQGNDNLKIYEQIRDGLHTLDAKIITEEIPPTKQGG